MVLNIELPPLDKSFSVKYAKFGHIGNISGILYPIDFKFSP